MDSRDHPEIGTAALARLGAFFSLSVIPFALSPGRRALHDAAALGSFRQAQRERERKERREDEPE